MEGFIISILGKLADWISSVFVYPTIEITQFSVESTGRRTQRVSFTALISNNTKKAFSVSEKVLKFFGGKKEFEKIDVTRYELVKKADAVDELNVLVPIDDIIMLQPGETRKVKIFGHEIEERKIDKVVFSCYTGRRTFEKRIKYAPKKSEKAECLNAEILEEEREEVRKEIKKGFEYLSKHIGAVTWISTVFVAVVAVALRFAWYVYQRGRLSFWKIDASSVSIVDGATLYNVVLLLALSIIVIIIMSIPALIFKSKMRVCIKIVLLLLLFIVFSVFVFCSVEMYPIVAGTGMSGVVAIVISMLILFTIFFAPSVVVAIVITPPKKHRLRDIKESVMELLVIALIWSLVMTVYTYWIGYDSARKQTGFRITSTGYAIIYETNDYYYLAEYDKINEKVNKDHQVIVEKKNVEYLYMSK